MADTSQSKNRLVIKPRSFNEVLLRAIMHLDPDAYGLNVQELLKESGYDVATPNIYAAMKKLMEEGYLTDSWSEPRVERGGRRRHTYRITDDGRAALAAIERPASAWAMPTIGKGRLV